MNLLYQSFLLLQSVEVTDISQIISIKELTVSGILLLIIYYFWKRTSTLEAKVDEYIKQKDEGEKRYYDLIIKSNEILAENNRIINENSKIIQKLERVFEKKLE